MIEVHDCFLIFLEHPKGDIATHAQQGSYCSCFMVMVNMKNPRSAFAFGLLSTYRTHPTLYFPHSVILGNSDTEFVLQIEFACIRLSTIETLVSA